MAKKREDMEKQKFDLEAIESTFLSTKTGELHDGVVVIKREDGVIFNIGGKRDAFIAREDFDDFEDVKIGDRFKVVITKSRNDEGLIEASKTQADAMALGMQNAQKLRLGSVFTFVPTEVNYGLISKMGDYDIFVPKDEISQHKVDLKSLIGKQQEAIVTEIDRENQRIVASCKLLQEQISEQNQKLFWNSIFINKIVKGTVKKVLNYGAFVDVDGVDCFVHISDLSHKRLGSASEAIKEGQTLTFKVIEVDRNAKKVKLGLKQILPDPMVESIQQLQVGGEYEGEVVKILPFGAIVKLENDVTGLLHISAVTERKDASIYEFVHLGDKIMVEILSKDAEEKKVSLGLSKKQD